MIDSTFHPQLGMNRL